MQPVSRRSGPALNFRGRLSLPGMRTSDRPRDTAPLWRFDFDRFPEGVMRRTPAVDAAAIVADLEAAFVDRLDQVKVVGAPDAHQHDVADDECGRVAWGHGDVIAIVDPAGHRMAARLDAHGLAFAQRFDCK